MSLTDPKPTSPRQPRMARFFVNQPSTLQPDHAYHGRHVLAELGQDGKPATDEHGVTCVHFTTGNVHSMTMYAISLSPGWPHSPQTQP